MTLIDLLDIYAFQNSSQDITLLMMDYPLDTRIDREKLNKIIIKDLGDMVPASNTPKVWKFMLEMFFEKWRYNIGKELDTMYLSYNTLHNNDWDTTAHSRTDADGTSSGTTETHTSAYDVSTYQPRTKVSTNGSYSDDTVTDTTFTKGGHGDKHTYQQLVQEERDLSEFNIYDWILERMRKELFLLVY